MGRRVMAMDINVPRQPHVALRLVGRKVVEDHVGLAVRVACHDLVHEVEKFDLSGSLLVRPSPRAGGDLQGGKQRRRPMQIVFVQLTEHRAAGGQLAIALGALELLDKGLLVDREDNRVLRRRHIQAYDLDGLGHKLEGVVFAPGFATRQIDLLRLKKAPNMLLVNIAQRTRQQRRDPFRVAIGRRLIEQGRDTLMLGPAVFGRSTSLADF